MPPIQAKFKRASQQRLNLKSEEVTAFAVDAVSEIRPFPDLYCSHDDTIGSIYVVDVCSAELWKSVFFVNCTKILTWMRLNSRR